MERFLHGCMARLQFRVAAHSPPGAKKLGGTCPRALSLITALCHRRCDDSTYFAVNDSDAPPNGEKHDVQSHMFRPTITDMQDKYCGNWLDIYLIQSQYKGNHKRGGAAEGRGLACR